MNFETKAIRLQTDRSQFQEHSTPLYLTSSFVFEDAEDMRSSFAEEKEPVKYGVYPRINTVNPIKYSAKVRFNIIQGQLFSIHTINISLTIHFDIK
jgi:O-acetylhomoserine/O-acetylserine sulfhydrylase-like pyridoxal-dependent enzyme